MFGIYGQTMPQFLEFYNVEFAKALFIMVERLLVTFVDDIYIHGSVFFYYVS